MLDIGANIGMTAVPIAKLKHNICLHSYEPIKENFSTLRKVMSLYRLKNVKLFNMALGNAHGTTDMIMPLKHKARQQGLCKVYKEGSQETGIRYTVPIDTLDNVYKENQNVTAIKIDVENFEYEVLLGARRLLKRCMPVIYCELWRNEKRTAVFEYLREIGYKIYVYNQVKNGLMPIRSENIGNAYNFFFLPYRLAKSDPRDAALYKR